MITQEERISLREKAERGEELTRQEKLSIQKNILSIINQDVSN